MQTGVPTDCKKQQFNNHNKLKEIFITCMPIALLAKCKLTIKTGCAKSIIISHTAFTLKVALIDPFTQKNIITTNSSSILIVGHNLSITMSVINAT